jgi:hypothetical protein
MGAMSARDGAEAVKASEDPEQPAEIRTVSGMVAALQPHAEGDWIGVRDAKGRLLVEVHADGGVVLHVQEGDLQLRAASGRVVIEGKEGVHISGPRVTVETPHLRQVVGVLETHAKRLVEKAGDAYRDVEGMSQLRAGQVRMVAEKTFRTIAERIRSRATKDAKILADKIYLG